MASNAGWKKEVDAKNRQKQLAANREQNEHSEWMNQRENMVKKKEEAEVKAKQEEEQKPEFLKNLASMKEKAQNKPQKKVDEGPTIADLDDGTDIPPWHRPGAPEKPEWVVLLLEAAKKEAEGDGEDEEHVFVAPTPSPSTAPPKKKQPPPVAKAPEKQQQQQPEWMTQASNLKKSSPTLKPQVPKEEQEDSTQQPWMKHLLKPSASPQLSKTTRGSQRNFQQMSASMSNINFTPERSKSADDSTPQKPEWMLSAARLKKKKNSKGDNSNNSSLGDSISSISSLNLPDRSRSANESFSGNEEKPEWMLGALRLKKKKSINSLVDGGDPNDDSMSSLSLLPDTATTTRSAEDSFSGKKNEKPEWMLSAARLKKKSSLGSTSKSEEEKQAKKGEPQEEEKPWLMRNKLKPRVSPEDLKSSKVQEQLQNRPQLKKPPVVISKDALTTNKVQDKLKKRLPLKKPSLDISKDQLETSQVRAKLASRPSIVDKKAPVKKEEMEWMKKKLKPRGIPTTSGVEALPPSKPSVEPTTTTTEKPEWMKRASNLQQVAKETQASTIESSQHEKQQQEEEKPWLMRNKLKPRVSAADLKTSIVQEKLENKPQLKKSPLSITSDQLRHSKVQEKLAQRPSIPHELKGGELDWMKKKLNPTSDSTTSSTKSEVAEDKDSRPSWMKEIQKKNSKGDNDINDDKNTPTSTLPTSTKDINATAVLETSASGLKKKTELSDLQNNASAVATQSTKKAEEPELDPDSIFNGEEDRDILGILQGKLGATATANQSLGGTDLIQNERFWSSLADFGSSKKNDSDSDDSDDDESEVDMEMTFSGISSADDFLSHPKNPRSGTSADDGAEAMLSTSTKSSKERKKAKTRSRSSSLDRKSKKKKDKKKEKKHKKDKDNGTSDAKKKKKKEKKEREENKLSE